MKNQALFFASIIVGGLSFGAAGCILGSNPNENSMLYAGGVGGTPSNAGTGGNGGSGGPTLGELVGTALATYDTTVESFAFSTYPEPSNLAANGGPSPTLDFDAGDGSPSGGSLKVYAPYSGANQYVDIQSKSFSPNLQNWSGGKLHVRVKVDAGSTFMGQIEPYADTGSGFVFVGTSINVVAGGGWHDYVVTLNSAMTRNSGYDLTQVIVYGVHIGSGGGGSSQGPVTFHIDSFSIEGIAAPATDAGTDTTAPADTGT